MESNIESEFKELKKDFENLLGNYWYVICTRECTPTPIEHVQNEQYAKDLMKKWKVT